MILELIVIALGVTLIVGLLIAMALWKLCTLIETRGLRGPQGPMGPPGPPGITGASVFGPNDPDA